MKLSSREAQIFYVFNRAQYEPRLLELLNENDFVVTEDYWGTGVAWGTGAEVDYELLMQINAFCRREDLALYFQGERFKDSIEKGHTHEDNGELMSRVEKIHEQLAQEYKWQRVDASQSKEQVHEQVWQIIKSKFL